MTNFDQCMLGAIDPATLNTVASLQAGDLHVAHYTSADNADKILRGAQFWLRSAALMNDFREIDYGIRLLEQYFAGPNGREWREFLSDVDPMLWESIQDSFRNIENLAQLHTYIASFSLHREEELSLGKLSMWRAYGGQHNVAMIFKGAAFTQDSTSTGVFGLRVRYETPDSFALEMNSCLARLRTIGQDAIMSDPPASSYWLDLLILHKAIGTKHPGFHEEAEWRLFYAPLHPWNRRAAQPLHAETIGGIPQSVFKLELDSSVHPLVEYIEIPDILNSIIVGPTTRSQSIGAGLMASLRHAGVADAVSKVRLCGIPFRRD